MRSSDSDSSPDFGDSIDPVIAPPSPWLAFSALLIVPIAVVSSIPFWKSHLHHQLYSPNTQPHASDPGQLGGFALVALVFATGIAAAIAGLFLNILSHRKRERFVGVRGLAWITNGFVAFIGLLAVLEHLL